jgi:5-methylcytosine-specific restriction endonuclease McrA
MTLDHVTPRKGQTAYDRRDNLVLACKRCNAAKADKPFLAFLFASKTRAKNLLRYGEHLSEGILDLCRQLAGNVPPAPRPLFGKEKDWESPYKE